MSKALGVSWVWLLLLWQSSKCCKWSVADETSAVLVDVRYGENVALFSVVLWSRLFIECPIVQCRIRRVTAQNPIVTKTGVACRVTNSAGR